MKNYLKLLGLPTIVAIATFNIQSASAAIMSISFNGNDCSGFFGQGFENCDIGNQIFDPVSGNALEISPVIAKYDQNLSNPEINSLYEPN